MPYVDPAKQAEYQRQWILQRRREYLADKVCAVCGGQDNLEVDHIDRTTKTKAIDELIKKHGHEPVAQAVTWRTGIGVSVDK